MYRCLKTLFLTLALAASVVFIASCGSSGHAQMRMLNAIPDGQEIDVDVNGTKEFSQLSFQDISPATGYTSVPSDSVTVEGFLTGTSTPAPPNSTFSISSSTQYLVVLTGFNDVIQGVNAPTAVPYTDNNSTPASGTLEFRIINASPSSPGGLVDVYIEANPFDCTALQAVTPTVAGLAYQQGSGYQSVNANSLGSGFAVCVTASGAKNPLIQQNYNSPSTGGTVTTLVLVDIPEGGQMSQIPIALSDVF
jgi:Domain of unknown function (DUF4397)